MVGDLNLKYRSRYEIRKCILEDAIEPKTLTFFVHQATIKFNYKQIFRYVEELVEKGMLERKKEKTCLSFKTGAHNLLSKSPKVRITTTYITTEKGKEFMKLLQTVIDLWNKDKK